MITLDKKRNKLLMVAAALLLPLGLIYAFVFMLDGVGMDTTGIGRELP